MTEEEQMEWLQKQVINYLRQQPSEKTPKPMQSFKVQEKEKGFLKVGMMK